jgi:hypothetical protein
VEIATNVVAGNHVLLVRLANIAIIYPYSGVLALIPNIPPHLNPFAQAIAAAGLRIATEGDPDTQVRRRGAVVERVVWELVRKRDPALMREKQIELTSHRYSQRAWCNPKEIISYRSHEYEVHECKLSPNGLDKDDVDELADIRDTAVNEGLTSFVGVATLDTDLAFQQHAKRLRTHGPLHYVTEKDVLRLGGDPPIRTFSG